MNSIISNFPYKYIRAQQDKLIEAINNAIKNKKNLIVHAPTGLGKTVAALLPSIIHAKKKKLTVMFLTSRNTQHILAIRTLQDINSKLKIVATDLVGKKHLCLQAFSSFSSGDMAEYCKLLKKEKKCNYYINFKKNESLTPDSKLALGVAFNSIRTSKELYELAKNYDICPYELAMELTKNSDVIVADYQFIFNKHILRRILTKIDKTLDELILIIDEAHNLPSRIKDQATARLTTKTIKFALHEAKKFNLDSINILSDLYNILEDLAKNIKVNEEKYITKQDLLNRIELDFDEFKSILEQDAEFVREKEQKSSIGSIAGFFDKWPGKEEGFARIITRKEDNIVVAYKCLDPSIISKEVINNAHSTIIMSGTLNPTSMYKEVLGVENAEEHVFKSPFPEKNRLLLIVPKTTTKFTKRDEAQYKKIAIELAKISDATPGNIAIFFPSYFMLENVNKYFSILTKKTILTEDSELTNQERTEIISNFKKYMTTGAVLLAVLGGSFSEGIDLPGENLKAVVIVGLPLQKPDLETKALINYFDKKFNKGWDYGYLFPAFNKTLQGAGRCIRTETDKGAIIFLDERYIWSNYKRCFPKTWKIKTTLTPDKELKDFFNKK